MRVCLLLSLMVLGCVGSNQEFQITDGSSEGKSTSLRCSFIDATELVGVGTEFSSGPCSHASVTVYNVAGAGTYSFAGEVADGVQCNTLSGAMLSQVVYQGTVVIDQLQVKGSKVVGVDHSTNALRGAFTASVQDASTATAQVVHLTGSFDCGDQLDHQ